MKPSDRAALHQAAKRRGLIVRFEDGAVIFFRQCHLAVQLIERAPDGWRTRGDISTGLELLAELPSVERARDWFRGFDLRQASQFRALRAEMKSRAS